MANIDVVKWDAPMGIFAWKFPSEELSAKTQLIVSESQEAILIKDGQMVGPFEPGKHTLNSNNYPFLTSLLKKEVTGRTPFTAEVWFIQKTFKLNIKWGTRTPIQLEDPQYHVMLPIRAYGQYGIQIENSAKFLIKIVGTLRYFNESDLISYLRGIILTCAKDQISKYIIEKNISILKISILLKELSENIEKMIIQECATFGILINNFNIESITTDDNDPAVQKLRNALAEKAEMDIMGYSYQQKRTFDTMQTAAGNESNNSIMNAGIGMGLGMGFGIPAGNIMANMGKLLETENTILHNNTSKKEHSSCLTTCNQCGETLPNSALFCPKCGKKLLLCSSCGTDNSENNFNCIKCGKPLPIICKTCGEKNLNNNKFCEKCGSQIILTCTKCGTKLNNTTLFCPQCGTKI